MRYALSTRLARLWRDEGGWIGAALAGAGLLGNLFSKGAQSSAGGRKTESDLLIQQDALRNQQYGTQQNAEMNAGQLDLQRKGFTEQARGGRAKQATIADMLANFTPTKVQVPGITNANVSGGLQVGEGAKASLAELYKQALAAQMSGEPTFSGGAVLTPPSMSALPKAGGWEKAQGILGTLGTIAGGLGAAGVGGGGSAGGTYTSPDAVQDNLRKIINRNAGF